MRQFDKCSPSRRKQGHFKETIPQRLMKITYKNTIFADNGDILITNCKIQLGVLDMRGWTESLQSLATDTAQ